jgi:predicted short-subunit dehydrogenase-like oxidoreductase (DUF2520 family)
MVTKSAISIIGAGRVGRALGRRLREQGWKIASVVTRGNTSARRAVRSIGAGQSSEQITAAVFSASTILLAVPERSIVVVAQQLAALNPPDLSGKTILHTSGALDSSVLSLLRELGAATGSIHPLQSFSGIGIPRLEGRIFAIEGDPRAIRVSRAITRAVGGQPVLMSASSKPLYHAAAVFAASHVLALQQTAIAIFASIGIKRSEALQALLPLTRQVLENLQRVGPDAAWTGPLSRRDYQTIARHEEALRQGPPEYLDAYRAVTRLTARVLARDPESVLRDLSKNTLKNVSVSQSTIIGASA